MNQLKIEAVIVAAFLCAIAHSDPLNKGQQVVYSKQQAINYQWQQILFNKTSPISPPPLCGQQCAVSGNTLLLFGGCDSTCCSMPSLSLWSYDMRAQVWSQVKQSVNAEQRVYHTLTNSPTNNAIILWGGIDQFVGKFLNDFWTIQPPAFQWTLVYPNSAIPSARPAHSAVLATPVGVQDTQFWIYGGRNNAILFSELWRYSFSQNMWVLVDPGSGDDEPGPRAFHSAISYSLNARNFMLVFGGTDGAAISKNDLWRYDFQINDWAQITPKGVLPPSRVGHQALVNQVNGLPYMWIFGGQGAKGELDDVWVFDINNQVWSEVTDGTGAGPRSYFCAAALSPTSNIVYGGYATAAASSKYSSMLLGDLWTHSVVGS